MSFKMKLKHSFYLTGSADWTMAWERTADQQEMVKILDGEELLRVTWVLLKLLRSSLRTLRKTWWRRHIESFNVFCVYIRVHCGKTRLNELNSRRIFYLITKESLKYCYFKDRILIKVYFSPNIWNLLASQNIACWSDPNIICLNNFRSDIFRKLWTFWQHLLHIFAETIIFLHQVL